MSEAKFAEWASTVPERAVDPAQLPDMTPEERGPVLVNMVRQKPAGWTFTRGRFTPEGCHHEGCQGGWMALQGMDEPRLMAGLAPASAYVLVWNSTPESDGRRKPYGLRLNPDTLTYRPATVCAGVAQTFGRFAHGWYPKAES